ncbi:MAG: hydrogenase maturation protease [Terriglobales bacterium]
MKDLRQRLEESLKGRVCLMGLGNFDYGDDGFGVRLAEELLEAGVPDVIVAGTAPDRYIGRVADGGLDHVIFLDAVDFGGAPGSAVFLSANEIAGRFPQISTHKISLGALAKWAETNGTTQAWLLGVQPESLKPAETELAAPPRLTPAVRTTLEVLRDLLLSLTPPVAEVKS